MAEEKNLQREEEKHTVEDSFFKHNSGNNEEEYDEAWDHFYDENIRQNENIKNRKRDKRSNNWE